MCSIIGYCGRPADLTAFQAGFARTVSRGPDDSRVIDVGQGILGFHRLSIMGLHPEGMQPFGLNGSWVVCNGEIYGFEKLKQALSRDYTFTSESDCEVLLPMYEKYGVGMFAKLDAEFACILYDGKQKNLSPPATLSASARCITATTETARSCLPANRKIWWG